MYYFFNQWQTIIGAIIGAFAPFLLWWVAEKYRQHTEYKKELEILEKIIVDQINLLVEARRTITIFVDKKIQDLIKNIEEDNSSAYHIGHAFFPLFAIRKIDSLIHNVSIKSTYLYNKLAKAFSLSADFPLIIEDLKKQFEYTIQNNRELSILKANSPESQKALFVADLTRYSEAVKREMLEINIPVYLKILIETHVALSKLMRLGNIRWQLKFNPRYKFFFTNKEYQKSLKETYSKIESFFSEEVNKLLEESNNNN